MHSKSDNIEVMINDETDEVIKEFFDSLKDIKINNRQWDYLRLCSFIVL